MCIPWGVGIPLEGRGGVRGVCVCVRGGARQGQGEHLTLESRSRGWGVFSAQTPEEEADKGLG